VKGCSQNPGYQGKKLVNVFFLFPSNIKQPHKWSKNDMWKSMEIPYEKPMAFWVFKIRGKGLYSKVDGCD